jgi:hypothetical protein
MLIIADDRNHAQRHKLKDQPSSARYTSRR